MSLNTITEQDAQFAAEFNADVTREELARVYANALAGACEAKGISLDSLLDEYDSLLQDILTAWPKFEALLSSAMVNTDQKLRMIKEVFQSGSQTFRSFLETLARRGRLDLLRDINRQTHALNDKQKNRIPVLVTTAAPLDETSAQELIAKLRLLIGGEPEISLIVDPKTIGGIIVRVGDTVFDASLATQLKNVRQQMIDRSTHEIQSRRDRFRNTEGN